MVRSWFQVFHSPKMLALVLLGFSSGLPYYLTDKTLQAWMTVEKVDLAAIGLFSLVGLPYSLKFLWSPLLDRFALPLLGRRRGWLVLTQVLLLGAIALMAWQRPQQGIFGLGVSAVVVAFLSATQDIAADAYRVDVLTPLESGAGAAIFVLGYRVALLLTGSLALILADHIPWPQVYGLLAGCMVVGIWTSLRAPEPPIAPTPGSLIDAVLLPLGEFFQRLGLARGLLILVFILCYKLGDAFVNNMSTPFLLQTGFRQGDVGAIQGGVGIFATIVGTLAGGAILSRIGINRSLWVFGGLQAVSNLAYWGLAQIGANFWGLILTINIENFCAGLGTAAFVAFLMNLCNQEFSATQYALLSSFMAVSGKILVAPAGVLAQNLGWSWFFALSIGAALPGLLLLPFFAPWQDQG
ncbi:MAG: AmpG family muropeptide MFS transporter [Pseudanabaenaceae cyanobacterium bins.68]|nr:AmpG family muropeptide MFS transporter [Pseudanabaenaceae cyanobacterium bins.68]